MIDFQIMQPAHPARDIWYFFQSCTDSAWRKQHLDPCLKAYFDIFSLYLEQNDIQMSYEEFRAELEERRHVCLFIGPAMLPVALNPERRDVFASWSEMRNFFKWQKEMLAAPDKEDDHPMILEIRRRLIDLVEEGREIGLF